MTLKSWRVVKPQHNQSNVNSWPKKWQWVLKAAVWKFGSYTWENNDTTTKLKLQFLTELLSVLSDKTFWLISCKWMNGFGQNFICQMILIMSRFRILLSIFDQFSTEFCLGYWRNVSPLNMCKHCTMVGFYPMSRVPQKELLCFLPCILVLN